MDPRVEQAMAEESGPLSPLSILAEAQTYRERERFFLRQVEEAKAQAIAMSGAASALERLVQQHREFQIRSATAAATTGGATMPGPISSGREGAGGES